MAGEQLIHSANLLSFYESKYIDNALLFYGTSLANHHLHQNVVDKVITTMVIRPLDDGRYCAPSVFTHLGL